MQFDVDLTQVKNFEKWCGKQPPRIRIASARMLNSYAYGVRTQAVDEIGRTMTVRNPKFVSSSLRYTKASSNAPVAQQQSVVGSVARPRFSGWAEQEYGTRTDRKRYATLAGRSGSISKQIRPVVRLKPKNRVVTINSPEYKPRGGSVNFGGFVAMLLRNKENRLILMKRNLYKRKRDRLELVQVLRKKQPKQNHWLMSAAKSYFATHNPTREWVRIYEPLMGKL